MTNLFIVNTPFHLLTSFIIANSHCTEATNYLVLINPHGYAKREQSPILHQMCTQGFYKYIVLTNFLSSRHKEQSFKEQIRHARKELAANYDNIFLGSDIYPQNQILVAALGHTQFIRYEDGLYSYYNECRRHHKASELYHKLRIKLTMRMSGIKSNLYINTSTASDSPAGIADYMYNPQLLQRYSPCTHEITSDNIQEALAVLKRPENISKQLNSPALLYLSQPLVEQKILSQAQELQYLRELINLHSEKITILYKAHPNDHSQKAQFYQKAIPELQLIEGIEPAELLYARESCIKAIVSYQSTALLYTSKFTNRHIYSISLADIASYNLHPAYKNIMMDAGVLFPKTMEELQLLKLS